MKKIYLILAVVVLVSLLLIGCQFKAVETSVQDTPTIESATPSAEEAEVSQGLEDMNDLDQLEKEINGLEVEDLGNVS